MADPQDRFRQDEDEDEEEEVDETVSQFLHNPRIALTATTGLQDCQRCRLVCNRRQQIHDHEASSVRFQESRSRLSHLCRSEMRLPAYAAANHLASHRHDGGLAIWH